MGGSSPCVWGQEIGGASTAKCDRIIPMRVGTSRQDFQLQFCHRDHPHACGDKPLSTVAYNRRWGSSPCVWGQDFFDVTFNASYRIIPMRVGTRYSNQVFPSLCWDHPHACGDKLLRSHALKHSSGSSPCVWGQARQLRGNKAEVGIIPMRVGTSCHRAVKHYQTEDHPHACGDK